MDRLVVSIVAGFGVFFFTLVILAVLNLEFRWVVFAAAIGATGALAVWLVDWISGRTNAT